jgi:uncharacterized protein
MSNNVRDNTERRRFELETDGQIAFAVYRREGDALAITHTETPVSLRGKGVASALVRGILDIARAQGMKVLPKCPFVAGYIDKHPEYGDLRK